MKLIKIKRKGQPDLFLPNCWPSAAEPGKPLKFFTRGDGWKTTKSFQFVEGVELPERWDPNITWLDIAKLFDQYGIEVANCFAECKTAGIVSRQTAKAYGKIYQTVKHLPGLTLAIFENLCFDFMFSSFGLFTFDVMATDQRLSDNDPDYNSENCTYKGQPCSMQEYVAIRFGQEAVNIIRTLCDQPLLGESDAIKPELAEAG